MITKILTQKVKSVMSDLISDCQGAFILGHSIFHNITVANEVVRGYSRADNSPRCTIKVDLRKAFDSIR